MEIYIITANAITGAYEADGEREALEYYACDAGYDSYEELVHHYGEVDSIEKIELADRMLFTGTGEMVTVSNNIYDYGNGIEVEITFSDGSDGSVNILDLKK